jgi:hypothetical protein
VGSMTDHTETRVRFFHRTVAAEAILADGFQDATYRYMTDREWTGVWLSDLPLDDNDGAHGDVLLALDLPAEVAATLSDYEWVEDGKPYREWLVPAAILNEFGTVTVVEGE